MKEVKSFLKCSCRGWQPRALSVPRARELVHVVVCIVFLTQPSISANARKTQPSQSQTLATTSIDHKNGTNGKANPNSSEKECKVATKDEMWKQIKSLPVTIPRVPAFQRFKYFPLNRPLDVLVIRKFEQEIQVGNEKTKERIAYRIILEMGDDPQSIIEVPSNQISSAGATPLPHGTDFLYESTKEPKTILTFTPSATNLTSFWDSATLYVIGCSVDSNSATPLFISVIKTNVSSIVVARNLAIFAVLLFYILAAVGTFHIHKAQRKKDPLNSKEVLLTGGTNYAGVWAHIINPVVMTAGPDGRGSVTKLQILFFSLVVFGLVAYIWMLTGHLSDMSTTVLLLMGIAGLGATVSAGLDVARKRLDFVNWAWLVNRKWLPVGGFAEINVARWKDIMTTEGEFDVYRFQMITFSVLVGAALLSEGAALANLESFAIPQALLGILGLSQVVYLGGRLAAPPAISDLDNQIHQLREMETKIRDEISKSTLISSGINVTNPLLDGTENGKALASLHAEYLQMLKSTKIMFQSALGIQVDEENMKSPFLIAVEPQYIVRPNPGIPGQTASVNVMRSKNGLEDSNEDGCEVPVVNATADEDLPASRGGVAT